MKSLLVGLAFFAVAFLGGSLLSRSVLAPKTPPPALSPGTQVGPEQSVQEPIVRTDVQVAVTPAPTVLYTPPETPKAAAPTPDDAAEVAVAFAGRVTEKDSGKGIAGALVEILELEIQTFYLGTTPAVLAKAETDADGRYRAVLSRSTSSPMGFIGRASAAGWATACSMSMTMNMQRNGSPGSPSETSLSFELGVGGFISGFVVDSMGKGIAKANVGGIQLGLGASQSRFQIPTNAPSGSAVTDALGAFKIDGLPMGEIILPVRAEGYVGSASEPLKVGITDARIVLGKGEATLTVRVKESSGQPVANAFVFMVPASDREPRWDGDAGAKMGFLARVVSGSTNAKGEFVASTLLAGTYSVQIARAAPGTPKNMSGEQNQRTVTLVVGDAVTEEFTLEGDFVLEGRALDEETNLPLAGAVVLGIDFYTGRQSAAELMADPKIETKYKARTGIDGRFRISVGGAVSSGVNIIQNPPPGYIAVTQNAQADGRIWGLGRQGRQPKSPMTYDLLYRKASALKGTVLNVDGVTPAPGVSIQASQWKRDRIVLTQAKSGEDGTFEIPLLPGCDFALELKGKKGGLRLDLLTAPADQSPAPMTLTLLRYGNVSGTVTKGGKSIGGIHLNSMVSILSGRWSVTGSQTRTNDNGYYFLESVVPGALTIEPHRWQGNSTELPPQKPMEVTLKPGELLTGQDFELFEGEFLDGMVTNEAGEPINGASVVGGTVGGMGINSRSISRVMTDEAGYYKLTGFESQEAIANVSVNHPEYEPANSPYVPVSQRSLNFTLKLSGGAVLTVVDSAGRPATRFDYRISVWTGAEQWWLRNPNNQRVGNETGTTILKGLNSGTYRIEVAQLGSDGSAAIARGKADFTIQVGVKDTPVTVVVSGGQRVSGRVVQAETGAAVSGAAVSIDVGADGGGEYRPGALDYGKATTDANGSFSMEGVPTGDWKISAQAGMLGTEPLDLVVEAGRPPAAVMLTLPRGRAIFGRVVGADGKPVVGAALRHSSSTLVQPTGNRDSTLHKADRDGRYRFEGLAKGQHIVAYAPDAKEQDTIWEMVMLDGTKDVEVNFDFSTLVALSGKLTIKGEPWKIFDHGPFSLNPKSGGRGGKVVSLSRGGGEGTYKASVVPGEYELYREGETARRMRLYVSVPDSPKEQAHDFNVVFANGDVVIVFPDDRAFEAGEVTIAQVGSAFANDYTSVLVSEDHHTFEGLPHGQYQATYTSRGKEWRGDSETVTVRSGQENMFVIEAKKFDRRLKVGSWISGELSVAMAPKTWDITELLASGGELAFLVEYRSGNHAVATAGAELLENGRAIASDQHAGWSGTNRWGNVYRMSLAERKAGARYEVRIMMRTDGGTDSFGDVFLNLN